MVSIEFIDLMDSDEETPRKKPRLDSNWNDDDNEADENDDLWGQEVLTAEEFDMLELQATQRDQMNNLPANTSKDPGPSRTKYSSKEVYAKREITLTDEVKKQQFALEGKVKMLSESLDKTVRELNKERMGHQQTIILETEKFKKIEKSLRDEIEKMQSALQFKDQEMKHTHDKMHTLEMKMKEKNNVSSLSSSQAPPNRSPNKFLNRFNFEHTTTPTCHVTTQTDDKLNIYKKVKLKLLSPKGELKGFDVMAHLLMTGRGLNDKNSNNAANPNNKITVETSKRLQSSLACLAARNDADEMWSTYENCLERHIKFLQNGPVTTDSKVAIKSEMLNKYCIRTTNNQLTVADVISMHHDTIILCLRGLSELLLWCLPPQRSVSTHLCQKDKEQIGGSGDDEMEGSIPLFNDGATEDNFQQLCLKSLLLLTKPNLYPKSYPHKQEELLHALNAILSWSSTNASSLGVVLQNSPLLKFSSGEHGLKCAQVSLQLLSNLVFHKEFQKLLHGHEGCIFLSLAALCHIISHDNETSTAIAISLMSSFLCKVISVMGVKAVNDNCCCSTEFTEGYITLLWRHYEICIKSPVCSNLNMLTKGILALHQLAIHMISFKDKRVGVENHYVRLIFGISNLCKKNEQFKLEMNSIHHLWDFQDYVGEFDPDES